jgi:hypothetical protein
MFVGGEVDVLKKGFLRSNSLFSGLSNMLFPMSCKYSKIWLCHPSLFRKTELLLRNQKVNNLPLALSPVARTPHPKGEQ